MCLTFVASIRYLKDTDKVIDKKLDLKLVTIDDFTF